jgi:26S proteasome regulatory subunit N13
VYMHSNVQVNTTAFLCVVQDAHLFPGSAEFVPVQQCTDGRVFLLKFIGSSRRMFFWMQEPSAAKDNEIVAKVNQYINNPPQPGMGGGDLGGGLPGGMTQEQLMQMLGSLGGSPQSHVSSFNQSGDALNNLSAQGGSTMHTPAQGPAATPVQPAAPARAAPTATEPAAANANAANPLSDVNAFSRMLASIQLPAPGQQQQQQQRTIRLGDVLTADNLAGHLADPAFTAALQPLLAPSASYEDVGETLRSAPFKQMLSTLSEALDSGDPAARALLSQVFGVHPAAPGVEAFLRAVQEKADREAGRMN